MHTPTKTYFSSKKPEITVFSLDYGPKFAVKPGFIALGHAHLLLNALPSKKIFVAVRYMGVTRLLDDATPSAKHEK
jgi:hypothetical protein